jgi:hypothetical protein
MVREVAIGLASFPTQPPAMVPVNRAIEVAAMP